MAEKIKSFQFSRKFKKEYQKLPDSIQKAFDKKLDLLQNSPMHPSLRVKRVQGTKEIWEGSITMKYRFTFEIQGACIFFRAIGTHDILNRE